MKLLIFGATGATGRHLVEQALSGGHWVTAFVREPARLGIADPSLNLVVGDVLQPASVDGAFGRFDAVLCALVHAMLRDVMDDKVLQEAAITGSAAQWTIVRPVKLSNGPARGRVKAGERLRWHLLSSVTRADVAAFMLSLLTDRGSFHRALTVKA